MPQIARSSALFLTLALSAAPAFAQSGVRGETRSGGGRSPAAAGIPSVNSTPPSGIGSGHAPLSSSGRPDARLGAGSVRPRGGNVLSPGLVSPDLPPRPGGNVIHPGTPPRPTAPAAQPDRIEPAQVGGQERRHHDHGRRSPSLVIYPYAVYVPFGSDYSVPNVINIPSYSGPQSSASHSIITAGEGPAGGRSRGEPKIIEVPADENSAAGDEAEAVDAIVLVALEGGLVYAVNDYWGEGQTLHFTTIIGDTYVVSIAEVDLALSTRLNRERGVPFRVEFRPASHR